MSFFLFRWIGNMFHDLKVKIAPAVVGILEVCKGLEDSGIVDAIAKVLDHAFRGKIAEDVNTLLKKAIPSGIAAFLAIEDLPDNPTADDIKKFETDLLTAIAGKKAAQSIAGQVNTNLGAQLFTIIQNTIKSAATDGGKVSFGAIAAAVEEAYLDYQNDLQNAQQNQ